MQMSSLQFHYQTEIYHTLASTAAEGEGGNPMMRKKNLYIFDFDSTLFKSPLPNPNLWSQKLKGKVISDCSWFLDRRTLHPPYIPESPSLEWWNQSILEKARAALADESNLVIVLTGRNRAVFHERISYLCRSQLPFHYIFTKENKSFDASVEYFTTIDFKLSLLNHLLCSYPSINHIECFDDRKAHIEIFKLEFERLRDKKKTPVASSNVSTIQSMSMHHVCFDDSVMPEELEKELVLDLIRIHNDRITACFVKQLLNSSNMNVVVESPVNSVELISPSSSHLDGGIPLAVESVDSTMPIIESLSITNNSLSESGVRGSASLELSSKQRGVSISNFRTEIELIEHVNYCGIFLSAESRDKLSKLFRLPHNYRLKSDHFTVSFGHANQELIDALGGIGTIHVLKATHIGQNAACTALRLDPSNLRTENEFAHITLFTSSTGNARSANDIIEWMPLQEGPLLLEGTLGLKVVTGIRQDIKLPVVKKEVSIGELVLKHHGKFLKGKEIGQIVAHVQDWMNKQFVDNLDSNRANIEFMIQNLDVKALLTG